MANKFKKFSFFDDNNMQLHLNARFWQGFSVGQVEPGAVCREYRLDNNRNNSSIMTLHIYNISCGSRGVSFRKFLRYSCFVQNPKEAFQNLMVVYGTRSARWLRFWQQRFKLFPQLVIYNPGMLCHWITFCGLAPESTKNVYLWPQYKTLTSF